MNQLNGGRAHGPEKAGDELLDLRDLLRAIRRRKWIIVAAVLVIVTIAWSRERNSVAQYTATALLQKEEETSSLLTLTPAVGGRPGGSVASQIEVMRSRAVLHPVVDSLGLRLALRDVAFPRSAVFSDIHVAPDAPAGVYQLRERSGVPTLFDARSDAVIATADPTGLLYGPGFDARLEPGFALEGESLELVVKQMETAVATLRRRLEIRRVPDTSLMRMSYTDPDPELAAAMVSSVAASYQEHDARIARDQARRRRAFIADQLASVADSLRAAQLEQLDYQEMTGTLNPEVEAAALIAAVMDTEAEVRSRRYQETVLTQLAESLTDPDEGPEAIRRLMALGAGVVPGAESLYSRLQDLQAERSRLTASRFGYTSEGPTVEVLDSLIADTRHEVREVSREALAVVRMRRLDAEERVAELRREVRALPERSTAFGRLRQETSAIASTYDLLAEKYYEAQIAEALEGGDVEIVDPPTVPVLPEPSQPLRSLFLALVLGVMVGTGTALTVDYFDRKVRLGEEAEAATGLPILSGIPMSNTLNGAGRPTLIRSERSKMAEAFRSLYTMIRFSRADWPRLIAVTSPEPAAGKSTVAANLALIMAGNHQRVLLLDADIPRPMQHNIFNLPLEPGLSAVLVGEQSLQDVVHRSSAHNLDIVTAGTPVPHSADLLASDAFSRLMKEVSETYDAIVVDTPPTLVVADTATLAPAMEGILMVARVNSTNRDALRLATDQLRQVGGRPLGVVLNGVESSGYGYGYGYQVDQHGYTGQPDGKARGRIDRLRRLLSRSGT